MGSEDKKYSFLKVFKYSETQIVLLAFFVLATGFFFVSSWVSIFIICCLFLSFFLMIGFGFRIAEKFLREEYFDALLESIDANRIPPLTVDAIEDAIRTLDNLPNDSMTPSARKARTRLDSSLYDYYNNRVDGTMKKIRMK